jgi:hypothetical protein
MNSVSQFSPWLFFLFPISLSFFLYFSILSFVSSLFLFLFLLLHIRG